MACKTSFFFLMSKMRNKKKKKHIGTNQIIFKGPKLNIKRNEFRFM